MESPVELMIQVVNVEPKGVLTQTVKILPTPCCAIGASVPERKKKDIYKFGIMQDS